VTVQAVFRLQELRIVVNSKYGAIMSQYGVKKVAAESLIARINSKCKLATQSHERRKIVYKNEIFKANKHALEGVVT
jgi:hypothetical protein